MLFSTDAYIMFLHKGFTFPDVSSSHCDLIVSDSLDTMDWSPPGCSIHGILQQECWSGLPCPSPGDLPNPRTNPSSSALAGGFLTTEPPGKPN